MRVFYWVNVFNFNVKDTWTVLLFDVLVTLLLTLNRVLTAEMVFPVLQNIFVEVKFSEIWLNFPIFTYWDRYNCFHLAYSFFINQWMQFLYYIYMYNRKSIMHFTLHFHRIEIMNTFDQLGLQDSKGYFRNELCSKFDLSVRTHIYITQVYYYYFFFLLTHFKLGIQWTSDD